MGMFDKDKEIGTPITDIYPLDVYVAQDKPESRQFVLWSANVDDDKVETEMGLARKTRLVVADIGKDGEDARQEVSTLASAIADKAEEAEPDDFPCVVKLMQVTSKKYGGTALVLQYVKPYSAQSAAAEFDSATAAMAAEDAERQPSASSRRK